MCRNIKNLFNFDPPTSDDEIRASALQFVRKVSGSTKPSKANQPVFDEAVDEVTAITQKLLAALVTQVAPRSREEEAAKAPAEPATEAAKPKDSPETEEPTAAA